MIISLSAKLDDNVPQDIIQPINPNLTEAFNIGVTTSVTQLLNITNNCQVAAITYQNFSRQIVDVLCVKQLLINNNITLKQ